MLKLRRGFQIIFFDQEEKHIHSYEKFIKIRNDKQMTIQGADTASKTVGGFSGSSPPVSSSIGGDVRVPEDEEIKYWNQARQGLFLLRNLCIGSIKHPHNFLSYCCSLVVRINVIRHFDAGFSHSKPLSEPLNRHGPLLKLRLRFRFISFIKGALFPNFSKVVECEFLFMGVQQLEDTFSVARTNLPAWLNILGLGANDGRREVNVVMPS